jgi:hypothetical protein
MTPDYVDFLVVNELILYTLYVVGAQLRHPCEEKVK